MIEAGDNKYFVDGFLIKHFGIWPEHFEKDNLFDEQKMFLIYLMATIPSVDSWSIQVEYEQKLSEIKNIKDVKISQSEIDLANLHGKNISELKKEKIKEEKQKRIKELNQKFGVKEEEKREEIKITESDDTEPETDTQVKKLWDILQLRGLTKDA